MAHNKTGQIMRYKSRQFICSLHNVIFRLRLLPAKEKIICQNNLKATLLSDPHNSGET